MKSLRSLLLLLCLAMVHSAHGQPEVAFEAANAAYEAGEYDDALTRYEALLETHRHFESEFNAGNAAFKLGAWGRARLHYERAKLLDPSNEHLQANLALLESKIVDRITAIPKLGLTSWLSSWVGPGRLTGWVCWTLLWWSLSWVLWMVRWRKTSQDSRNTIGFLAVRLPAFGADRLGLRARIQRTHGVRPTIGRHVRTRGCDQLSLGLGHGVVSIARRDARMHFGPNARMDRSRARQRQRGMDS